MSVTLHQGSKQVRTSRSLAGIGSVRARYLSIIAVAFLVIHGALLVHGANQSDAFLAGDRSVGRMEKINYVFNISEGPYSAVLGVGLATPSNGTPLIDRVLAVGHPGDYVFHGALFSKGGKNAIILFQLLLLFLAITAVYALVILLGCSELAAFVGAVLYMVLPGSLIHAHQLSSEALFNPLVVFAFSMVIFYVESRSRYGLLIVGLILLSLGMFVRPQLSLYPIVLVLILAVHFRSLVHPKLLAVLPVCFLLSAVWATFVYQHSGSFSVGGQNHGPEVAFFKTAQRMSVIGDFDFDEESYSQNRMSLVEFTRFSLDYPAIFVKLKTTEVINLVFNSGIYSVAGHHLQLLSGAGNTRYWKELRDLRGMSGMIREVLGRNLVFTLLITSGTLVWGVALIVSVFGGFQVWHNNQLSRISRCIIFSYLIYGLTIVLVSSEVRWGHRTSVEFLIVIFFSVGLQCLMRRPRRLKSD